METQPASQGPDLDGAPLAQRCIMSTQSHSEGGWGVDSSVPPRAHSNAVAHWWWRASSLQHGFAGLGRHSSHSLEGSSHRPPVGRTGCPEMLDLEGGSSRRQQSRAPRGALSPWPVGNGEQE